MAKLLLQASCGFLKKNPFNNTEFRKRFNVLKINIRMQDSQNKYIHERLPKSISDLESKLDIKVISHILRRNTSSDPSQRDAVLCLVDSSFDVLSITNGEIK